MVLIESERFIGDSLSVEKRYYLSSLPADAKLLNECGPEPLGGGELAALGPGRDVR